METRAEVTIVAEHRNKCSAVAEMGHRLATIDMGRKEGGCCAPSEGQNLISILHNAAWAEVYLSTN